MVLVVSEKREVRLGVTQNIFSVGNLRELLLIALHIDVLQNDITGHFVIEGPLVTLVGGVDEFRP